MRCPKCGYTSFDHNLLCPKCRKDLTATRRLLNLTVPAPGAVDFFNTAGQRGAFPEPLLGNEMSPDQQPGFGLPGAAAAGAMAASSPFGAPSFPTDQQPFGAPPFPPDQQPFGAPPFPPGQQPFGAPPFAADATIDDIMPLADDEITAEDIVPIAAEADLEEIVPIGVGGPGVDINPMEAAAESTQIMVDPILGEEEIEIEIDDLLEPDEPAPAVVPAPPAAPAPVTPVTPIAPESSQTALDHIKNTLAATGDLSAQADLSPPAEVFPEMGPVVEPAERTLVDDLDSLDVDLDGPLIGDIDDSDIFDADDLEASADSPSDTVAVDLDPDDLAPVFFDEMNPEPAAAPEPAPALESAPELEPAPNLEELAQGDLAGPFWDEEAPPTIGEAESQTFETLTEAEDLSGLGLEPMADAGIEPEDLALGLETDLSPEQELTAEEMFAEEIQPPAAPLEPVTAPPASLAEAAEKTVHPTAVPEIPANVFGSIAPEATLTSPQASPGGLEADDLSSLADDINLDDLDSEL